MGQQREGCFVADLVAPINIISTFFFHVLGKLLPPYFNLVFLGLQGAECFCRCVC